MGGLRKGLGRLAYRSVTHPEARPGLDDLGALLAAMPFSSDRAVLAGLPRWSSNGTWTAARACGRYRPAGSAGLTAATGCALTGSARSQKTDHTFMYELWVPHPPARRAAGRPGRAGSAWPG
jgi:hypothetical protein